MSDIALHHIFLIQQYNPLLNIAKLYICFGNLNISCTAFTGEEKTCANCLSIPCFHLGGINSRLHVAAILLSQLYLDIMYALWISVRGGSGQQLFQLSQQFATVC